MAEVDPRDIDWYLAATLRERLGGSEVDSGLGTDLALGQIRLQRWQEQKPFSQDSFFDRRMALDGLTQERFLRLLGESAESVKLRLGRSPEWLSELTEAFGNNSDVLFPLEEISSDRRRGFLYAIQPLLGRGRERLRARIRKAITRKPDLPFDPDDVDQLFLSVLVRQLIAIMSPTMALELHVAGLRGELQGDSAEEKFVSFVERLRRSEISITLLKEYSPLARHIVVRIAQWVDSSFEFLARLAEDWTDLKKVFSPDHSPGRLVGLEGGQGDRHCGGRSVVIACFNSGLRIVYKPRSLAVEEHFQKLLGWINERNWEPAFRTVALLNRDSYGWVEYVEPRDCESPEQVCAFYERQGGYLALLYSLRATDFHYENVIAAGEHPVLVDLESLFHPDLRLPAPNIELAASREIASSVLWVGLLPQQMFARAGSDGVDVSGLGAREGQLSPQAVPVWQEEGTSEMRLIRKHVKMPSGRHRPTLNGAPADTLSYMDSIATGFERMYRLILGHREAFLAPAGPLSWFTDDEVRVVFRPTRAYAILLQEGFHPNLLRDALDRDRHFDRLWLDAQHRPFLEALIPHEREALQAGDVPRFTTCPGSHDLLFDSGDRIVDFFQVSGLDLVRERLAKLGEEDLRRQLWIVRATLATLAGNEIGEWRSFSPDPGATPERDRLISMACSLADRILALMIHSGDEVGWLGLTRRSETRFGIATLRTDLYNGLPGIALFLAYLGRLCGNELYTQTSRAVLQTVQHQIERQRGKFKLVGGFEGWGGLIYVLSHLGILWDEPVLLDKAREIVSFLPELVSQDEAVDVINGSAGCIVSLLALHRCSPSENLVSIAVQCGDRLLTRAQETPHGLGWPTHHPSTAPLIGFAHGAAGIAWALLELAAWTGEERFRTAAEGAIAYERSLFSPEVNNWPDLRIMQTRPASEPVYLTAWCFGAPGIGLARLRAMDYLEDKELEAEVRAAVQATLAEGFGLNHCLCHGDLGNLEFLLQAERRLGRVAERPVWQAMASSILDDIASRGPLCATPRGVESPGLMTGLAGIGYGLLRLADPDRIPSVLTLEPPRL